jgi:hypothetical protein
MNRLDGWDGRDALAAGGKGEKNAETRGNPVQSSPVPV